MKESKEAASALVVDCREKGQPRDDRSASEEKMNIKEWRGFWKFA